MGLLGVAGKVTSLLWQPLVANEANSFQTNKSRLAGLPFVHIYWDDDPTSDPSMADHGNAKTELYKIEFTEAVCSTTATRVLYRAQPWRPNYKAPNSITAVQYCTLLRALIDGLTKLLLLPGYLGLRKSIDLKGSESTNFFSIIIIRSA